MTDRYDQAISLPRLLADADVASRQGSLRPSGPTADKARWMARRERLPRLFRDAYHLGSGPADLLGALRGALPLLPPDGAFSHQTAAALHGFGVLDSATLHITVPAGAAVPRRRGITTHQSVLPLDGVVRVLGLPCLPPARVAVELARTQSRPDALAVLDAALRATACTARTLAAETDRHDGSRGVRQARELCPLADPLAQRRQETHMRLLLYDARLPAPTCQLAVADASGVARHWIDLGYEQQRVGIDYDGQSPLDLERVHADRRRHIWLADNGWRMRYFTDDDLDRRPAALVQMVRATLGAPGSVIMAAGARRESRHDHVVPTGPR